MSNIVSAATSSVGKKVITGLTGIALGLFVIVHLAGNLTLFLGEHGKAFNEYAHLLESMGHGWLLPVAEISLVALFVAHIAAAVSVSLRKREARPVGYYNSGDAGHTSKKTPSSQSMIYSGIVLLAFLLLHIWQFRIANLSNTAHYPTAEVRDLYRIVYGAFQSPLNVGIYVVVMLFLGLHLRHGLWSAWQSLGLNNRRVMPVLFSAAVLISILLAVGFLSIPVYLHFNGAPPAEALNATALEGGHP
ncbi:MAG: succinate dehydrogenase [Proteobacteria bacterium]|nr:succinate dehydrogenase [Pseudomonadota bacterium]